MKASAVVILAVFLPVAMGPLPAARLTFPLHLSRPHGLPCGRRCTWGFSTNSALLLPGLNGATPRPDVPRRRSDDGDRLSAHRSGLAPNGMKPEGSVQIRGEGPAGQAGVLATCADGLAWSPQKPTGNFSRGDFAALNRYLQNGSDFAIGRGRDCHLDAEGMVLRLPTKAVPEPASLTLIPIKNTGRPRQAGALVGMRHHFIG